MFPAPLPWAPPHTSHWQRDTPEYEIFALPDGIPGPRGFHFVRAQDAVREKLRRQAGLPPTLYGSPPGAPQPGQPVPVFIVPPIPGPNVHPPAAPVAHPRPDSTRDRTRSRTPRVPRPPRARRPPREPRAPRAPRFPRPPRDPRAPRAPRPPRAKRPPRPPRKPRAPRIPKTKGQELDYYCAISTKTGRVIPTARGFPVPKGDPPPPDVEGQVNVINNSPYGCMDTRCTGPLSPILNALIELIPDAWRPRIDQRILDRLLERNRDRRAKYAARGPRPGRRYVAPIILAGPYDYYCPVSDATGKMFGTGGGIPVPHGAPPPDAPPGTHNILRTWPGPCELGG